MTSAGEEIEVKFHVLHLSELPQRVLGLGGQLLTARVHELNLRFDTTDRLLSRQGKALRLRRDALTTITYKGRGEVRDGIRIRPEHELAVGNFDNARRLLEGLGFQVSFTYEKYRATYTLDDSRIMLDELPYGDFVEIEGEPEALRETAARLDLRWEAAIPHSYLGLFENVRKSLDLLFEDLTFDNFRGLRVGAEALGVMPADA